MRSFEEFKQFNETMTSGIEYIVQYAESEGFTIGGTLVFTDKESDNQSAHYITPSPN